MRRSLWSAMLIGLALPAALAAQQAQPGVIVVSQQKCENVDELNDWMRANAAPILNDLVEEGQLLGWGILGHMWGDEWNHVVYYLARDNASFHAAFGEFFGRLMRAQPDVMARFEAWCSDHRDNIYSVVMTEQSTM